MPIFVPSNSEGGGEAKMESDHTFLSFFWNPSIISWVGRGKAGITGFSNMHVMVTRPANLKSRQYFFEKNIVLLRPHLDTLTDAKGVPDQNKNES